MVLKNISIKLFILILHISLHFYRRLYIAEDEKIVLKTRTKVLSFNFELIIELLMCT